jgi:hypothetical protein
MFDYFMRFENKEEAHTWMREHTDPVNIVLDDIGVLYTAIAQGELDEDGNPLITYVEKQGYHVNVRSRVEIHCDKVIVVNTPDRVFA